MYDVLLFLHLVGVVGFAGGHGVSAAVSVRLGKERDHARLQALLDLSRSTLLLSNLSLLLIAVSGIWLWVRFDFSPQGWLWASIAILVLLTAAGFGLAAPHFRGIRSALAIGDEERLRTSLDSPLPWAILVVETAGVVVILWLMVAKPF